MSERKGSAQWQGRGKEGKGRISTETGTLKDANYGFSTRFEEDKRGTNPEELIAAAHAACFSMAFSFGCDKAGFATQSVDTTAALPADLQDERLGAHRAEGRRLRDRSHRSRNERRGARHRRGEIPGARAGGEGGLPRVEGAGRGAGDHAEGDAEAVDECST